MRLNRIVAAALLVILATALHAGWVMKSPMPYRYYLQASGVIGSDIYLSGGSDESNPQNVCYKYTPASDQWAQRNAMNTNRYGMGTGNTGVGNKLEAIAGIGYGGQQDLRVEEYDIASDAWSFKTSLPGYEDAAWGWFATATVNGEVYCIGNYHQWGSTPYFLGTVAEFDPVANSWTRKAEMPTGRGECCAAVYNGEIYVFGGYSQGVNLATVEKYNPATDQWTPNLTAMPTPRREARAVCLGDKIYVIGGDGNSGSTKVVEVYDPVGNTWSTGEPMQTARYGCMSEVVNSRIYAIGGRNESGVLNSIEEYTPGHPGLVMLDVPYYNQSRTPWCVATSVSMILKYHGIDRKPYWVAKDLGMPNNWFGTSAALNIIFLTSGFESYFRNSYQHDAEQIAWLNSPFTDCRNYVISQIREHQRPVMLAGQLGVNLSGRHAVVIVGFDEDSAYVNDPSGALLQDLGYPNPEQMIARGISWSGLQGFYDRAWPMRVTLVDKTQIPTDMRPLSIELLPWYYDGMGNLIDGCIRFRTNTSTPKSLSLQWDGLPVRWQRYPYSYWSQDLLGFPLNFDLRRSATQDCDATIQAYLGNSTSREVTLVATVVVADQQGAAIVEGSGDITLAPLSWSKRPIMLEGAIVPPLALSGHVGRFSVSLKIATSVNPSDIVDSCLFYFDVARGRFGGGQTDEVYALGPSSTGLSQITPNPFRDRAALSFSLVNEGRASLTVCDITGKQVRSLVNETKPTGTYTVTWDGKDDLARSLPNGIYICRFQAGDHLETRKLILQR